MLAQACPPMINHLTSILVIVISLPGRWSFYTLVLGVYNLLPRQHHCTREIWAMFLDVAWVMGYIWNLLLTSTYFSNNDSDR